MTLFAGVCAAQQYYGAPSKLEVDLQNENFDKSWGDKLIWKFDDLPVTGRVPAFRDPYSGYIYPDAGNGTVAAMMKYDRAFYGGRALAAGYERADLAGHRKVSYVTRGVGRWGRSTTRVVGAPSWYGHCNGWTSAAIRHAEPQKNVTRNGVVFTPSDIKGMLAELYIYSETQDLGGSRDYVINPAIFHVVTANWIGRKSYPIGVETTPGKEVWNFPLYAYAITPKKLSGGRQVEVRSNVYYANMINREQDKSPTKPVKRYFHYVLDLNADGEIVAGRYYGDSTRINMLWGAMPPIQGGKKGNEGGNPHLKMDEVLSIWRESVPDELVATWVTIDPNKPKPATEQVATDAPATGAPASDAPATVATEPATATATDVAPAASPENND